MIGKLSGTIDSFGERHLILDVGGVGYIVNASRRTLGRAGNVGEAAQLLTEMVVREDSMTLYGFIDAAEQAWFKLLTSVQGVGAKAGLAILSIAPPQKLGVIIAAQDKAGLTQADGVGPKLATRILTELKDKVDSIALPASEFAAPTATAEPESGASADEQTHHDQDILSALVNLGYARADAYHALSQVKGKAEGEQDLQSLIRLCLKELSA